MLEIDPNEHITVRMPGLAATCNTANVGLMALLISIWTGLTMSMGLVTWRENFGMDWRTYTALPHERTCMEHHLASQ